MRRDPPSTAPGGTSHAEADPVAGAAGPVLGECARRCPDDDADPERSQVGRRPAGLRQGVEDGGALRRPVQEGQLFIVRLKMPAGYKIAAHWHPTDENITVISGTFLFGMGDKLDASKTKAFPAGSFAVAPAKMNHFAIAKTDAVVEVSAIGPFAITYVNPADDPSKTAAR